jgi:hypothetical protein
MSVTLIRFAIAASTMGISRIGSVLADYFESSKLTMLVISGLYTDGQLE